MRNRGPATLSFCALLAGTVLISCQHRPAATGDRGRPAMTNAEYEMAQLRALGAATDAPSPEGPAPAPAARDNSLRTTPYLVPPRPPSSSSRGAAPSATAAASTPSLPARTGPVQKAGTLYIGPGGTSSRRVGSIMINSDGTTGQLIGNTIINN